MKATPVLPHAALAAGKSAALAATWHRMAPKKVVQAYTHGEAQQGWPQWQAHLCQRSFPKPLEKLTKSKRSPLTWAAAEVSALSVDLNTEFLRGLMSHKPARLSKVAPQIQTWLNAAKEQATTPQQAYETLALASALPRLAACLSEETWWGVLDQLCRTAHDAAALDVNEEVLLALWLGAELPLILGYGLPELQPCRELWLLGKARFSALMEELLDGEGLPHARHLQFTRPLLASGGRALLLGEAGQEECFTDEAYEQYQWLLRRALELTRRDGSQMMSRSVPERGKSEFFACVLKLAGQRADQAAAKAGLPGYKPGQRKRVRFSDLPESSSGSEWAALAMLRTGWKPRDARLLVKYDTAQVELELETARGLTLAGAWQVELEVAGKTLPVTGPWEEICWQADHDVAYIELECSLPGGWLVQRQILLAKDEQFLFLADAILGQQQAKLTYRGTLPLAAGTTFQPADETREGSLVGAQPQALVLPLALPEWRTDPRFGKLESSNGSLTLKQQAEAKSLYCPLLLDLHPRRQLKQRTWRQLTVAENRQIQPAESCVGYRAQCGQDQWFFYRSLGPKGNRTLLSHNLVSEFLAARFEIDGTVEELLEIE